MMHLKKHHFLLMFWVFLFVTISGNFGENYGIPYLLLDPEYLGNVGYLSFALVGICLGGLIVTWNITTYLINSHRFPFLASLKWPFSMYSLNNAVIPVIFICTYIYCIYGFQSRYGIQSPKEILLDIAGLLAGITLVALITLAYFQSTGRSVLRFLESKKGGLKKIRKKILAKKDEHFENIYENLDAWRVDSYITSKLNVRLTRNVDHYDEDLRKTVLKQHHSNALLLQLITISILIGLGFLVEKPTFQIPTAGSLLLLFSVIMALFGVVRFWIGKWTPAFFVFAVFLGALISKTELIHQPNKAYGLSYGVEPAGYSAEILAEMANETAIYEDQQHAQQILENWKVKHCADSMCKPNLVVVTASGGGLRSALFTLSILQKLDSVTNQDFTNHIFLMSGASGGTFGLTYFRELVLLRHQGSINDISSSKYRDNISKDLLNPIFFSIATNDIFYPFQKYHLDGEVYAKDRGYMMEHKLHQNTQNVLNKKLIEYQEPEYQAIIPQLLISSTALNDSRRLIISPQPVRFLMKSPWIQPDLPDITEVDAVDFCRLFSEQNGSQLQLSSALRMNATYPLILPTVTLPSEPVIEAIDAGARDNYGMEVSLRYLMSSKDWLSENVNKVILVQIRGNNKSRPLENYSNRTFIEKLINPFGHLYANMGRIQDYTNDELAALTGQILGGKMAYVTFEYEPEDEDTKAALSFHLTKKEIQDIESSWHRAKNQDAYKRLMELLKE